MHFTAYLAGFIALQGMRYMCRSGTGLFLLCGRISQGSGLHDECYAVTERIKGGQGRPLYVHGRQNPLWGWS